MGKSLLISIALTLAVAAFALAQPRLPSPPPQATFPEVSTAEVKSMMDGHVNFMLVDARTEKEYAEGHIPGAVNVPPEKVRFIAGLLPTDKGIPVVFYCRGYG